MWRHAVSLTCIGLSYLVEPPPSYSHSANLFVSTDDQATNIRDADAADAAEVDLWLRLCLVTSPRVTSGNNAASWCRPPAQTTHRWEDILLSRHWAKSHAKEEGLTNRAGAACSGTSDPLTIL